MRGCVPAPLVLAVPTRQAVAGPSGEIREQADTALVLPDTASVAVAMTVEKRRYGIYEAPVFASTVQLHGRFLPGDIAQWREHDSAAWQGDKAELRLVLADLRGLQEVTEIKVNGKPQQFASSAATFGSWPTVTLPLDLDAELVQRRDDVVRLGMAGRRPEREADDGCGDKRDEERCERAARGRGLDEDAAREPQHEHPPDDPLERPDEVRHDREDDRRRKRHPKDRKRRLVDSQPSDLVEAER